MRCRGDIRSVLLSCFLLTSCELQAGCVQEAPASIERAKAVLIALLQDDNAEIRRTAAESLGKIGERSAIPMVLPLLTDPLPAVRATAAKALGRMAAPAAADVIAGLVHALEDPSDTVKQAAALALGDIEPSSSCLALVATLLRSPDVHVRRAAVRAMLLLDTGRIAGWLLPLLDDPDAEVRQSAVAALGASGDPRAASALAARLSRDPSAGVRAEAAYHLGESNGQQLRTLLQTAAEIEADRGVRRWIEAKLRALRVND